MVMLIFGTKNTDALLIERATMRSGHLFILRGSLAFNRPFGCKLDRCISHKLAKHMQPLNIKIFS